VESANICPLELSFFFLVVMLGFELKALPGALQLEPHHLVPTGKFCNLLKRPVSS
jgi:hypothetical protein